MKLLSVLMSVFLGGIAVLYGETLTVNSSMEVREDTYIVDRDIALTVFGKITICHGAALALRNVTLSGVDDTSLVFEDETSTLLLNDAKIDLSCSRYHFTHGTLVIVGSCWIYGHPWWCCKPSIFEWNTKTAKIMHHDDGKLAVDGAVMYKRQCDFVEQIKDSLVANDFSPLECSPVGADTTLEITDLQTKSSEGKDTDTTSEKQHTKDH